MKAVTHSIVGMMLTIIALFAFFILVVPQLLQIITDAFSKVSAENVARQLSGLITISGASPHEIDIDYNPTKEFAYRIFIRSRTIKVIPKFRVAYAEKASSTQPFAVSLNDFSEEDANHFIIEKNFDGASSYVFKTIKE